MGTCEIQISRGWWLLTAFGISSITITLTSPSLWLCHISFVSLGVWVCEGGHNSPYGRGTLLTFPLVGSPKALLLHIATIQQPLSPT